jgi:hypothetical protein
MFFGHRRFMTRPIEAEYPLPRWASVQDALIHSPTRRWKAIQTQTPMERLCPHRCGTVTREAVHGFEEFERELVKMQRDYVPDQNGRSFSVRRNHLGVFVDSLVGVRTAREFALKFRGLFLVVVLKPQRFHPGCSFSVPLMIPNST